jgi:hypothetical protein
MTTLVMGIVIWIIGYRVQVSGSEWLLQTPGQDNPAAGRRINIGFVVTMIGFVLTVIGGISVLT